MPYNPACNSSNSYGVKKGSMLSSCGTIPILVLYNFEFLSISTPHILINPEVFNTSPPSILIKVDFPAPFGPNSPYKDPWGTLREKSFRALTCSKDLKRFFSSIKYIELKEYSKKS